MVWPSLELLRLYHKSAPNRTHLWPWKSQKRTSISYEEGERRSLLSPDWKYAFDFSRAKDEFGWEPIYDIAEGVRDWANYQRGMAGMQSI